MYFFKKKKKLQTMMLSAALGELIKQLKQALRSTGIKANFRT